jgi:hypothetical protein
LRISAPKWLVTTRVEIVASLSVLLFSFWVFLIINDAPRFQEAVGTDSLAMIDVLFPYFWVVLLAFVGICFSSFSITDCPRWLYMLLIAQLSLMLFSTPFLLSGFSWSPDSLWHGGIARYLPQILSGSEIQLSQYAASYPFSFLTTYFATEIVGINIVTYTLYIYPLVACVLIGVLSYFFAARVFGNKVGFLAMLFTLPVWHYVEPHVSPFSLGTILVLLTFVLLTYKSRLAFGLSLVTLVIVTLTHPISPISLGGYVFAYFFVGFFLKRSQGESLVSSRRSSFFILIFLGVLWFFWTLNFSMSSYQGVRNAVLSVFNLDFLNRVSSVSQFAVGGQGFIYSEIHILSLVIYGFFLVVISFPLFEYLIHRLVGSKTMKLWVRSSDETEHGFISTETLSKIFRALWFGVSFISVIWFLYWIFYEVFVWNKTLSQVQPSNYFGLISFTSLIILSAILWKRGISEKVKALFFGVSFISVIWFSYWIFYDVFVWNKTLSQVQPSNYFGLISFTSLIILGAILWKRGISEKAKTVYMQLSSTFNDKIALSFASLISAIFGVVLFLSSGERFLLGRGLLYFLLFGSMVFATFFVKSGHFGGKKRKVVALSLVVFLFCSFPVISYSKEAYNSFTPSAEAGLTFLSSDIDLSKNSLSMGGDQQLASYIDLTKGFDPLHFPPNLTYESPDVIVMRINTYYVISMRYALSFTNNSYVNLEEELEMSSNYNKIYSNGRFEIYTNTH